VRALDLLLDVAVVVLAAGTLAYDAAMLGNRHASLGLVLWPVLVLPGLVVVAALHRRRGAAGVDVASGAVEPVAAGDARSGGGPGIGVLIGVAAVSLATIAAVLVAVGGATPRWSRVWQPAFAAAVVGAVCMAIAVWRGRHVQNARDGAAPSPVASTPRMRGVGPLAALLVLGIAAGLATLSLFVNRPDADDVFYVNRAQWVVDHGSFPVRDTIFGDEQFAPLEHPAVPSYEPMLGAVARLVHHPAGDVAYYLVPPLFTFLAVLALWRLLRTWGARLPLLALAVGLVFLLFGGADHASFGNLFLARMWQGKILFLCVVVPLLFVHLTEWSRSPSLARACMLLLLGVAGVGLSATAALIVPVIAVAGLAPVLLRHPRAALAGFVAAAAYPVAVGIVIRLDRGGGGGADVGASLVTDPAQTFVKVFGHGALAGIALFAVLVGWLTLRRREGRATAAASALIAMVVLSPGMLAFLSRHIGSGYDLWRLMWVMPVAALVGALGSGGVHAVRRAVAGRLHTEPLRRRGEALAAVLASALLVLVMVVRGVPIWAASNHAVVTAAPQWKVDHVGLIEARGIAARAPSGAVVLAPTPASAALAVLTTRLHAVDPRVDYSTTPNFHRDERLLLVGFADGQLGATQVLDVPDALRVVGVGVVCTDAGATTGDALDAYRRAFAAGDLRCYLRA
jgi:hypothetical protein